MTLIEFDEKKLKKRMLKEIFIPNFIKLFIYMKALRYLVFLEILKESLLFELRISAIGIMGVYIGVNTYRMFLELILPNLNTSLEEVDYVVSQLFPDKKRRSIVRFWANRNDD